MDIKSKNQIALTSLTVAKLSGLAGVILGWSNHRIWGGSLLALSAISIMITVVLSWRALKELNAQPYRDEDGPR